MITDISHIDNVSQSQRPLEELDTKYTPILVIAKSKSCAKSPYKATNIAFIKTVKTAPITNATITGANTRFLLTFMLSNTK